MDRYSMSNTDMFSFPFDKSALVRVLQHCVSGTGKDNKPHSTHDESASTRSHLCNQVEVLLLGLQRL